MPGATIQGALYEDAYAKDAPVTDALVSNANHNLELVEAPIGRIEVRVANMNPSKPSSIGTRRGRKIEAGAYERYEAEVRINVERHPVRDTDPGPCLEVYVLKMLPAADPSAADASDEGVEPLVSAKTAHEAQIGGLLREDTGVPLKRESARTPTPFNAGRSSEPYLTRAQHFIGVRGAQLYGRRPQARTLIRYEGGGANLKQRGREQHQAARRIMPLTSGRHQKRRGIGLETPIPREM